MEDDLIVVDDVDPNDTQLSDHQTGPSTSTESFYGTRSRQARNIPEHAIASSSRLRGSTPLGSKDASERTTRSSAAKAKFQPKLKLKLSEKAAAQAPGMSFLGPYDRELDSDEEELAFEEQFILRMPPGEDCERLRKMIASREMSNDVWFKFKDSRRALFHVGNTTYSSKLVDLPSIIESQKTLDNKQMFKVADICQMLVVETPVENDEALGSHKSFNIEEFIWPHGITPPLHHVRKRRFRKRVNKRTIESVEQEVERLLDKDALASDVKYEVLENVNPDLSDSEFIERAEPLDAPTPAVSDMGDAATPGADIGEEDDEGDNEDGEPDGDIDEELAAELDMALGDEGEEVEDDGDEDEDDSEDDDEDDDDDEVVEARKLLNSEIRDLEDAISRKNQAITSSANPLIRKRFEDQLKKLQADLEMKLAQRDEMKEQQRLKKESGGLDGTNADTEPMGDEGDLDDDEGLFGSDDPVMGMAMNLD